MSENWPSKEQEIWFQAGVTGERKRIIKLLEDLPHNPDGYYDGWTVETIIALIKGETE